MDRTQLPADSPAATILTHNYLQHYSLPRQATVRERARLQSCPDDFRLIGTDREVSEVIGNGVAVNLATAVSYSVRESNSFRPVY